jgi:Rrf2 family iron-sulfur cluster assembly transcriptional regulator
MMVKDDRSMQSCSGAVSPPGSGATGTAREIPYSSRFIMKLTTKGRHAITAMMALALNQQKGPVTLADISDQQSISISYLEQLFAKLRQNGLVTGMRGPGGGYCLARMADEISIAQILNAVDDLVKLQENPQPEREIPTSMLMWRRLSNQVYAYLDSVTLADAVRDQLENSAPALFNTDLQKSAA